jgi:FKBP-type peptidyl-prolyl cis-trans isomerase
VSTRLLRASLPTWLACVLLLPACKPAASREGAAKPVEARPAADAPPPDLKSPPPDAEKTASGLVTKVLKAGRGEKKPRARDSVRVQYTGWKPSGDVISSSSKDGGAQTFALSGVVPGWSEGLQLMRVGEKRRLWIPNHLYYDRSGRPPSTVVYDIELLEIIEGQARPSPPDVAAAPKGATRTKRGLAYVVLSPGSGADEEKPNAWDRVTLSYAGWTSSGELFDSADEAVFDVDAVMPGWTELLQRMTEGERVRAWIPEALADAGRNGRPPGDVVFELELLSIERRPEPPRPPADVAAPPKNAKKTPSGLAYRLLARGHGTTRPTERSRVKLHYSGFTTDGKLFDSSVLRGAPKTVPLDSVIAGWREGLQLMVEGDRMLLWIPEKLAYAGARGAPPGMLVYELELLEIVK